MAFEITPDPGDRGEDRAASGAVGDSAAATRPRLVRDGVQVLGRGALICPICALPIAPPERIRPKAQLRCGFCDHAAAAREFVRGDLVDTASNEVRIVARLR